jgi:hypothetical protein
MEALVSSWQLCALLGVSAFALLMAVRMWSRRRLAADGCWWELSVGEGVSRAPLEAFMRTLVAALPKRLLRASPWVGLSVACQEDRVVCELFVSGGVSAGQVRAAVEQALGTRCIERKDAPGTWCGGRGVRTRVMGFGPVESAFLPLRVDHRVDPAGQLLALMRAERAGDGAVVQLLLQASPRWAGSRGRRVAAGLRAGRGMESGLSLRALERAGSFVAEALEVFAHGSSSRSLARSAAPDARVVDAFSLERARAIEAKAAAPLLAGTVRAGAWAADRRRARGRLGGLIAGFGQYRELGGLRRCREPFCAKRLVCCLSPMRPRLLLSAAEAAALVALPERAALAPLSFVQAPARSVAPVAQAPTTGLLLGRSDDGGYDREIRVEPLALLQHAHVLGPTGRGKSTLLLNLTLEAMRAGMGGIVLDPTGELTQLISRRVADARANDVDLLDLGDTDFPPALNLLACRPGEGEAHAQAICGIFARLFSRFWGPRTEDILRSALTTLLCGADAAELAPTLADVLILLSDSGERSRYRVSDPVALDIFWRQWQALSEPAQLQALAPLSNKLRTLLGNGALRNILCQTTAPDFHAQIDAGRWLLVSLPPSLGEDAADLIGSVMLHRAWQAVQRLGPLARSRRPPFLCVVDECHRFCHLPQGMATALAQARGYGMGLVLAHQHLAQLKDGELAEAVDANCQTKICFGLGAADSKRMAVHFQPRLDAHDLLHLGPHTIACRVLHEARQLPAATATTLPPPSATQRNSEALIRERARNGAVDRGTMQQAIQSRYGRFELPPRGRAQADEPAPEYSYECAPFDAPLDAPPDGAPPLPQVPHHHTGFTSRRNPDNKQSPSPAGRQ